MARPKRKLTTTVGSQCTLLWGGDKVTATIIAESIPNKDINIQDEIDNKDLGHVLEQPSKHLYYLHFGNSDTKYDAWVEKEKILSYFEGELYEHFKKDNINNMKRIVAYSEGKPLTLEEYPIKNIFKIYMNNLVIPCWYPSPYPDVYSMSSQLLICHICFQYFKYLKPFREHKLKCKCTKVYKEKDVIYSYNGYRVYKIDGEKNKLFSQNLCLFSKLFISHKDICYRVSMFHFYILCIKSNSDESMTNSQPFIPVGYFSREKNSSKNNLACILTLPQYQGKGYGRFLIEFSRFNTLCNLIFNSIPKFEISAKLDQIGSPERPLSKSGLTSYLKYWQMSASDVILNVQGPITIDQLSNATYIATEDLRFALSELGFSWSEKDDDVLIVQKTYLDKALEKAGIKITKLVKNEGFVPSAMILQERS